MPQIFISHTRKDKETCDAFDRIVARVGIKAFRSEFEEIEVPEWKTIKDAMNNSVALFFLVGKELVSEQDASEFSWNYTQNWIAYEIGLACQRGIDVWAICDNVEINFPMPYINNYLIGDLEDKDVFSSLRKVLESYKSGKSFRHPLFMSRKPDTMDGFNYGIVCGNCKMSFNLHGTYESASKVKCPQCLSKIILSSKGHPKEDFNLGLALKIIVEGIGKTRR